ncbi:oligopeptide/dipeptide ABC transporter ATP-binding protein [Streptomyces sp. NPDC050549]|uniref:oligopeptide/dipeptide ABC transporter ATP-binding protein n=1 Tax=Streptomyces sp. NPDC050549 TaxID=3155406 RepID=UPI00341C11BB
MRAEDGGGPGRAPLLRAGPPCTRGLLAALPRIDRSTRRLAQIAGQLPSPNERPPGCPFQNRCPHADERCAESPGRSRSAGATPRPACGRTRSRA